MLRFFQVLTYSCCILLSYSKLTEEIESAKDFLESYNREAEIENTLLYNAIWNCYTNITDYNQNLMTKAQQRFARFGKDKWEKLKKWNWRNFTDEYIRRQFQKISDVGESVLSNEKYQRYSEIKSDLEKLYSTAKVCKKPGDLNPEKCYSLEPDLNQLMANSTNWDELLWAWKGWRDETGQKMYKMFDEYAELFREAARINGFEKADEYWKSWYEMDNFDSEVDRLYEQIKPFYQHLHAYVKRKLKKTFKDRKFPDSDHIPAHLLGSMWSNSWVNIFSQVAPFPNKTNIEVTKEMSNQKYTVKKLFNISEEFFLSLNLKAMPKSFWKDSMLTKPQDNRTVFCFPSSWDFYNQKDFRILQCTEINMEWLVITHHEMGHIQYFLQYKHLPVVFRDSANPAFHEAIGELLALSVVTPEYLQKIDLLPKINNDLDMDINFLMNQALSKLTLIPFAYSLEKWRWGVFNNNIKKEEYNKAFWKLKCKYQGLSPPIKRHDHDLDPGSIVHVPYGVPYIRYFISHIVQFQFHEGLCKALKHKGQLHRCNIFKSKEAGSLLSKMMKLGSSKKWSVAMEIITGQSKMDGSSLLKYFEPLIKYLEEENKGHKIDWNEECSDSYKLVSINGKRENLLAEYIKIQLFMIICINLCINQIVIVF
ncbi:DgyrCDS8693 [Dimorphilus gyrociliatus]|uniref:Angiotensin-converting enzyme n=1 Tax=Dimorphilus gyrociliatus TaxID=2664684 RepID=A0A7I8VWM5_9ANNE|nr:DgyrCDS8693 [Dimorphilus gyrociliatus]